MIIDLIKNLFGPKKYVDISVSELDSFLKEVKPQILDVRTVDEYNRGNLKNSKNADVTNGSLLKYLQYLKKDDPILLYCQSGARSAMSSKILVNRGFTKVYNLKGGYMAYRRAAKS